MIQRIQTIYLLLIIATVSLLLTVNPIAFTATGIDKWTGPNDGTIQVNYTDWHMIPTDGIIQSQPNSFLLYTMVCCALVAFVATVLFRNRKMQLMLCVFNFVLIVAVGIFLWLYIDAARTNMFQINSEKLHAAAYVPIILPILNLLAIRGIRKDEKLIRSMDRLR